MEDGPPQQVPSLVSVGMKHDYGAAAESDMTIEVQSKLGNRARRLFVPVGEFNSVAFPVGINRVFPRCAGPVAPQVTSSRLTGATPTLAQEAGI